MHLTIDHRYSVALLLMGALLWSNCGKRGMANAEGDPIPFTPYAIEDSTRLVTYPDGLKLYVVEHGPGDYPLPGDHVILHYQGRLQDGTVFDASYDRGEPFSFTIGAGKVIAGIESAMKQLRLGSKAIAVVPPSLGYGDGGERKELPPKIPANATLTFHLDLVGSF